MARRRDNNSRIVYSTAYGTMCPACGQSRAACTCTKTKPLAKGDGIVRVGREKKGRKGKGVTVITGLALGRDDLRALAKQLKQRCGAGGTIQDGVIEIQGEHRDTLVAELTKQGYRVKRSGG